MRACLQRATLGATLLVIFLVAAVPSAQAKEIKSPWTWTDEGPALRDVSCSSPGACLAVGQRGVTLRSTRGGEHALAWTKSFLTYPEELTGVACTHSFCLAVSNTRTSSGNFGSKVYRSTDGGARRASGVPLGPSGPAKTRSAVAVACDPSDVCYAVGPAGGVWRSLNQGRAWEALALPAPAGSYRRVTCPSVGRCVAVGGDSSGSSALIEGTKVTDLPLPKGTGKGILGLACDTPTRCTATDGLGHFMSVSIPDKAWGPAKLFPKAVAVSALACPEQNVCVGLSEAGIAMRTTNLSSSAGAWHRRPLGTVNLEAISCAHVDCVAVGKAGTWWASFDAGSEFRRVNEVGKFDAIQCSAAFKPTCMAGGKEDIGVSRSEGELWSLPLSGTLGLDIKSVNCTGPSECLLLGKTLTLSTTNLTDFARRHAAATGPNGADALTCITKELCVAFNQGVVYTTLDAGVTDWTHNAFPGAPTSAACLAGRTNPAECVVTTLGNFIELGTMTDTGGEISWNWVATDADPSSQLAAIGCSPGGQCTAVGKDGEIMTSVGTNLLEWQERIIPSATSIPEARPKLTSVTCPAKGVCLAGGEHGPDAIIASTTNNWLDFSYDKIQGIEGADPAVNAIGCETVDRCVAVGGTALVGVREG
jgi:hypothetical protein